MSNNVQSGNILNKQIGGSRKGKYPDKEVINFIRDDKKKSDGKALLIFTLFMAVLLVFIYFAVILPLRRIDEAEANYKEAYFELSDLKEKNEELSGIEDEYNARVEMYYSSEELQYSNRKDIIDMIDEDIVPYLDNIAVSVTSDNQIAITATQADFETVSSVLEILQNDDRISYVKVTTSNQQSVDGMIGSAYTVDAQYEITWNTDYPADTAAADEGNEVNEDA